MPERYYGIRHHGPGSARAVLRALEEQRPDILLVEGPPEADELIAWAADDRLQPPVALLGYAADNPRRAAFWPFAVFSPEWQAIKWAVANGVPVRFFDLPFAHRLTARKAAPNADKPTDPPTMDRSPGDEHAAGTSSPDGPGSEGPGLADPDANADRPDAGNVDPGGADGATANADELDDDGPMPGPPAPELRPVDPIGELAAAAGYDDPERWWEDVVEHRQAPAFEAIEEAMTEVRAGALEDPYDLVREAHMRTVLRQVRRTHNEIAVVCGAWHVPALSAKFTATHDAALLKGGRRRGKVRFTWVPWTYGRLASWQGYGAGVDSPGWYHHLFTTTDEVVPRWLVGAAGVLRDEGVDTSPAHVIEATRLAEALATMRGRPLAGLAEVTDAAGAVLCEGDDLRLQLIGRRLVVGERLGEVPEGVPTVPLARDLEARQRAARLKPSALDRALDLDLRKDTDLARSHLLHQLRCLDVPWGEPDERRGSTGTFREEWALRWQPEFSIRLVEASGYGTTVVAAATTQVEAAAAKAATLAEVTALLETCLLADLPGARPAVLRALDARAAEDADVTHLMAAIPALARTVRYGDVRRSDVAAVAAVVRGLLARVYAALPPAASGLSDEAAAGLRDHIDAVHTAVALLGDDAERARWLDTLTALTTRDDLHGLLAGRLTRLLHDAGRLSTGDAGLRLGRALTAGVSAATGAAWVEGFLAGGGLLLMHDDALLALVDDWLAAIPADAFTEVLPLLRRTFGTFATGERRGIGERVAGGKGKSRTSTAVLDHETAALSLPTLSALLGRRIE
ncbi:hypothetical protein Ais01nite_82350 [Asanoa ishikariensis]|uniref:Uncharacterized protein n=1 Tax=Asanoa ishikariensis TaxID=137265 RepID=A0A1H3SBK1_9ACTN|nr:DUF5682 family protein [Asanoa ishikariensis]GIF70200.1 hypothetical protein Ais01nite_82350 [Asanoa ishikariensis]SDZ35362.1 hypothetical protein SAMN05421684_4803 [Asanoa ishikariensis]